MMQFRQNIRVPVVTGREKKELWHLPVMAMDSPLRNRHQLTRWSYFDHFFLRRGLVNVIEACWAAYHWVPGAIQPQAWSLVLVPDSCFTHLPHCCVGLLSIRHIFVWKWGNTLSSISCHPSNLFSIGRVLHSGLMSLVPKGLKDGQVLWTEWTDGWMTEFTLNFAKASA